MGMEFPPHDLRFFLTNASRLPALLRCPHRSALVGARLTSAIAATRSPRFISHRERSARAPSPRPPPSVVENNPHFCNQQKRTLFGVLLVVLYRLNRCHPKKVNKIKGFRYLSRFLSASLIDANLNLTKYG
jgi:hypothetical protein